MRTRIFPYILAKVKELNIKKYGRLTCEICGKPIIKEAFQYDHKIPVSKFIQKLGSYRKNSIHNLQIAHSRCNKIKSDTITNQDLL